MLWPNADAGSDEVSRSIRIFREKLSPNWLHVIKNLPTEIYIHLLNKTACLIGNSSSGIRDSAFIGTPVVNIGTRQQKRMRDSNVIDVDYNSSEILTAIKKQLTNGTYPSSTIYGDGTTGVQIADILETITPKLQKTITY